MLITAQRGSLPACQIRTAPRTVTAAPPLSSDAASDPRIDKSLTDQRAKDSEASAVRPSGYLRSLWCPKSHASAMILSMVGHQSRKQSLGIYIPMEVSQITPHFDHILPRSMSWLKKLLQGSAARDSQTLPHFDVSFGAKFATFAV